MKFSIVFVLKVCGGFLNQPQILHRCKMVINSDIKLY